MEASTTSGGRTEKLSSAGASQEDRAKRILPTTRTTMRSASRSVHVKITLMPGAEPWLAVTHESGTFTVPADVSALTLWDLATKRAVRRWKTSAAPGHTRVSNALLNQLVDAAAQNGLRPLNPNNVELQKLIRTVRS